MKKLFRIQVLIVLFSALWGCEDKMEKYYERPDWLRGNAYEIMQERGNFSMFLSAIDRIGYKTVLNGRELCTVMAPDDAAFQKYLARHGYSSIADVPEDTLKLLVTYHIVKRSYEPDMLLGFHVEAAADAKGDGTAFKFETYAQPDPFDMTNPFTGQRIKTANDNQYLPIISTRLFKTKKCTDYGENYRFFWPDVNWLGDDEQLYAQNAAVIEKGIPTDNGFLYVLDDVCEPLRTVYGALEKPQKGNFSQFLELYNRFAEVAYKKMSTSGDSLYSFNHYRMSSKAKSVAFGDQLPCLASTIGYHGEYNTRDDWFMYLTYSYNCLAPTNAALEDYFSRNMEGNFTNWKDVPQLTLYYMLRPYVKEGEDLLLPEIIFTDGIKGDMGEKWEVEKEDIVNKEFCSNGVVYGINQVFEPLVFSIVTKPLFLSPDYTLMANSLFKVEAIPTLTDQTADKYTLFIVPDTILEGDLYNMRMNYGGDYFNDSKEAVEKNGDNINTVDASALQSIADMSVVLTSIRDFGQRTYYATRNGDTYLYTMNGELYDQDGIPLSILQSWETTNGMTYAIDRLLYKDSEQLKNTRPTTLATLKNQYQEFYQLLKKAGLIKTKTDNKVDYEYIDGVEYKENECMYPAMYFIPGDLSVLSSLSTEELKKSLQYLIVQLQSNYLSLYVLPGIGNEGAYQTLRKSDESTNAEIIYEKLNLRFDNYRLLLSNDSGTSSATTGENVAHFTRDGLIFKIDNTILAK